MSNKWLSPKLRSAIEKRDRMICCYCKESCVKYNDRTNDRHYATIDHIVSRWEIARSCESAAEYSRKIKDPKFLVIACNACNCSKQEEPLLPWATKKGFDYGVILEEIARRIQTPLFGG